MNQELNTSVMAGLAWYYLLAAVLNAAAAAYVSYMEMVSEGASRVGLAPKTRRLPDWLSVAFFGLYGLATVMILGRHVLPGGARGGLLPVRPGQRSGRDHGRGRRRAFRRDPGARQRSWQRGHGAGPDARRPPAGFRTGQAHQPHPLGLDLGRDGPDLPGHGPDIPVRSRRLHAPDRS